ncbi:MAG TPA: TIGR04282 family arsenosugar biosynthesis glycosyltransferase [Ktedonobacterales bacterium]|nr:TIGR04282 family arsenosugar biosynthesis glycosyltransferase [Ktedonobacterales bacterium]
MPGSASIVIPALNEAAVIGDVVRRLRACPALQQAGITDIVVVDNGSDDDTFEVASFAGARVVREPRRGYGRACLAGVQAAQGADVIILMDGDGSDVPEDVVRVWQPVEVGMADLAMGSRVRGQCERGALTPQQRAGNAVGSLLLRWLYGVRVSDLGPLRAIRRETLLRMEMSEMTYGWSAEMLAKAGRLGLRVLEVPVDYRCRAGGKSKVAGTLSGTIKASYRILSTIGRYRRWQPDCPKQALFIMSRLPLVGQTKTRLGATIGNETATSLYQAFLRDLGERFTLAAGRDGYDLFWYYTAPDGRDDAAFAAQVPAGGALLRQEGADFAARLWHGFQAFGARGYERVVVIGSDSPHLPAAWVAQAFAALTVHDVVVGPAQDGGYYLLGQRVRGAPVDLFSGITMSTATVCAETLARAEAAGLSVALTPATFDVDESDDLDQLRLALRDAPSALADAAPATQAFLDALPSPLALAGSGEN